MCVARLTKVASISKRAATRWVVLGRRAPLIRLHKQKGCRIAADGSLSGGSLVVKHGRPATNLLLGRVPQDGTGSPPSPAFAVARQQGTFSIPTTTRFPDDHVSRRTNGVPATGDGRGARMSGCRVLSRFTPWSARAAARDEAQHQSHPEPLRQRLREPASHHRGVRPRCTNRHADSTTVSRRYTRECSSAWRSPSSCARQPRCEYATAATV